MFEPPWKKMSSTFYEKYINKSDHPVNLLCSLSSKLVYPAAEL